MVYKLQSALLLLAGIVIALGGLGHSFGGVAQVQAALAAGSVPPQIVSLILVVWYFAGACMVVLGLLTLWQWRQELKGRAGAPHIPQVVGVFYLVYGLFAVAYTRGVFFSIFIVLGVMLLVAGFRRAPATAP